MAVTKSQIWLFGAMIGIFSANLMVAKKLGGIKVAIMGKGSTRESNKWVLEPFREVKGPNKWF